MSKYFIHDGQTEKGPLTPEQLKLENLKKETPIWYEGLEHWTTAGEVKELSDLFQINATPPPFAKPVEPVNKPQRSYAFEVESHYAEATAPTKKKFSLPVVALILAIISICGWLIYENKLQADTIDSVQEQFESERELQVEKEEKRNSINAELTEKYTGYRNNWSKYISVGNNAYTYLKIGGISDLAVVAYNQTDKIIDEIQVRVDYLKTNGGIYKSEIVSVTNIAPNSDKTVSAPNSERGVTVNMEIISISSKAIHFCYPDGMTGNRNADPYFCK